MTPDPPTPVTYRDLERAIFLTFALVVVYQTAALLTTVLLFFLLVFILAAVINPVAVRLEERGIPRIASAVGVALLLLLLMGGLASITFPPLVHELGEFFRNLDEKRDRLTELVNRFVGQHPELAGQIPEPGKLVQDVGKYVTGAVGLLGKGVLNVAVGILTLFLMLVLVIFTVAQPGPLIVGLLGATPEAVRPNMISALRRILEQLKNWAFGSLILGLIIGVMTGIGLLLLGAATGQAFPYVLMFSVIAGVGELIPNIGPVISAIPPILVALTIDPALAGWVLVLFIAIQQLENNLIVPVVMGQSLNLHPVSVTFTVLVMGVLFGLIGAILAVPVCAIVKVCWEEFYLKPSGTNIPELETAAAGIVTGIARGSLRRPANASPQAEACATAGKAPEPAEPSPDQGEET